jgi:thiamine-phosphate pyrophosphorylase
VNDAPNHSGEKPCDDSLAACERAAALRILDANLNRASEGLRVVEDYCRFALDDAFLTRSCKQLRHALAVEVSIAPGALAAARESSADVGAENKTPREGERRSLAHVATANWRRVQQALRVIEETLKLLRAPSARNVEKLRYEAYTLDKACRLNSESRQRLAAARLYVLLAGGTSECAFAERAAELIAAGVHAIQLRDKRLDDRTLLSRARLLRRVLDEYEPTAPTTHHSPLTTPLLILNDRPDLAVLARADGVHVGQDELSVHEVRQIVGPDMLIGVSTHAIEQARQAVLDGANYLGCGPTFPSITKEFDQFPGLTFLRQVAAEISLPAFAIGGITLSNLPQVLETGIHRVAIGGASADAAGMLRVLEAPRVNC